MSTIQLTRAQRREMQKLADRVDRVTQADRRFFERFPHRMHRIRLASQAEIEQNAILMGSDEMALPPWQQHFVAVKNVAPGHRMRLTVVGPTGAETDLGEEAARGIYEVVNNAQARSIEVELRKLAGVRA
jgi:hypothetical protein